MKKSKEVTMLKRIVKIMFIRHMKHVIWNNIKNENGQISINVIVA